MQRRCYSLHSFCMEHDLNYYTFKLLRKVGLAPHTFKIGSKEFVTEESAAAWRRMMTAKRLRRKRGHPMSERLRRVNHELRTATPGGGAGR